jgi:hypothetical protein
MDIVHLYIICGIINILTFVYYRFLAIKYLKESKHTTMIYINTTLPLAPAIQSILALIKYLFTNSLEGMLELYFFEWMITTPLLLITLSSIKDKNEYMYSILTVLCEGMILSGYISSNFYLTNTIRNAYILFGVGSCMYGSILFILCYIYKYSKNIPENQGQYNELNKNKLYKILLFILSSSWIIYPIVFFLFINDSISMYSSYIVFSCSDFISKGLFTLITIGYELNKLKTETLPCFIVRRVARIEPEPFSSNVPEPGEPEWSLSQVPHITQTCDYDNVRPNETPHVLTE